jgi:hypothetical protein
MAVGAVCRWIFYRVPDYCDGTFWSKEMKHPHAEILQAFALDTTVDIEGSRNNGARYLTSIDEVIYNPRQTFRIRPKERCVTVDGVEYKFPEPMRVAPKVGANYWIAHSSSVGRFSDVWGENNYETRLLKGGFLQETKAGAEAQRRAIIALSGGTE